MERQDITGEPGDGNRFAAMPEEEAMKKQTDFFGVWASITEACGENDIDTPFDTLCDEIFKNEYSDGKEAMDWLEEEYSKIKKYDNQVHGGRLTLMDVVANFRDRLKYFYTSVGYALAKDYEITRADAIEETDYLRKRIRESRIFPLIAKGR